MKGKNIIKTSNMTGNREAAITSQDLSPQFNGRDGEKDGLFRCELDDDQADDGEENIRYPYCH